MVAFVFRLSLGFTLKAGFPHFGRGGRSRPDSLKGAFMSRLRPTLLAILVLSLALAGPAAAAQPPSRQPGPAALTTFFSEAWQRLTAPLAALWAKGGGSMDPDGKPLPPPPSSLDTDGGGGMDPNGRL
jgi:hypothetical protein